MAQNQPFALRSVLESNKLNETNYADWIRNLRIVLREANKEDVLDNPSPIWPHVIKMVGYTQRLEKLGFPLGQELATDFILASLPPSYGNFVSNYHMHGLRRA